MIIYIAAFLIFSLNSKNEKIKYFDKYIIFLFILAISRNELVGTDYKSYIHGIKDAFYSFKNYDYNIINYFYINSSNEDILKQLEPLWLFVNYTVYTFGGDFYIVNAIIISTTLFVYIYSINNSSKYPQFSLFLYYGLYYYFISYNTIRQSIAISIILLFYDSLFKKKWILASVLFIIAILFHFSAFYIAVIIIIIPFMKINFKLSYVLLVISIILGLIITDATFTHYFKIQLYDNYVSLKRNQISLYLTILMYIIQIVLFVFVTRLSKERSINCFYTRIWFIGLIIQNIFIDYIHIYRFVDYLLVAQIIAIPNYFNSYFGFKHQYAKYTYIYIIVFILFSINLLFNRQGIVPYNLNF